MNNFLRFPHTPHLAWLGNETPRGDKLLSPSEAEAFLSHRLVLEEKVDGANLGFSVDGSGALRVQNRGQYLRRPFSGQFARLNGWLAMHEKELAETLGQSCLLFGEWVAAVHGLEYGRLPDYFLVFDVYERGERRFWSTIRRNEFASCIGLSSIRQIGAGCFRLNILRQMVITTVSAYRDGGIEGLYLRQESDDWLLARTKLVSPAFVQGMGEHWRSRALRWNALERDSRSGVGSASVT